jgi:hypothetical protein
MTSRTTATMVSALSGIGIASGAAAVSLAAAPSPAMSLTAATAPAPQPMRCPDGRWIGPAGINVEGQPPFDAGDSGAAYIWHDGSGWHLRTTDAVNTAHHYTGTIAVSGDASVVTLQPLQLERSDHVWRTNDNVIHYDFTTYTGVDGLNFTVSSCDPNHRNETLHFHLVYNGSTQDPARVKLGPNKQHPPSADFIVQRSV